MKKNILFLIVLLTATCSLVAQTVSGTITNDKGETLYGATVKWQGSSTGVIADVDGAFELPKQDTIAYLIVDYVGYEQMMFEVLPEEDNLALEIGGIYDLMEVEVAAKRYDNYVSTVETLNVETIGSGELRKAACCNLSETFSTNVAVDVSYSDAVTGAKEIMMLGLRGNYTQMTVEKRPAMTGLGSAFALEYLPGTWLNSIQISKGTGSVQHGYQAIAGQINTELVKPFEDYPLFVNLYGSTFGRGEANVHLNKAFNDKLSMGLLLHGSFVSNELDQNDDTFYDTSQKELLDGMFRIFYRDELLRMQLNVHALKSQHESGQIVPDGVPNIGFYQIAQQHDRVEVFGKAGYLGFKNQSQSLGFITNASWHSLDSYYGNRFHQGTQKNFYSNLMFVTDLGGSANHALNTGISFLYDDYEEKLNETDFSRTERVPGIHTEYTYDHVGDISGADDSEFMKNLGVVLGLRVDYHNLFGWLITPRTNVSYNFSEKSIARISAGRGYRTANVIAENIGMLASSRQVVVLEDLDMEEAWNVGVNFTQKFTLGGRESSLSLDAFRTSFVNQVIMDMDSDFQLVQFYNLEGESYSNSLIAMLSYDLSENFDIKFGYKFNDVKFTLQDGITRSRPMVAKHRGLVSVDFKTVDERWDFNVNTQLVGKSRFVHLIDNPSHSAEQHIGETKPYAIMNAHINFKARKNLEFYIGGENLTNFRQQEPILDWQNPFGEYFDATHVYAPITGTMGYAGLRFWLE